MSLFGRAQIMGGRQTQDTEYPATLGSALLAWWDASDTDTITASSNLVSQWDDKSSNARVVAQSTGSAKPTSGLSTQNGLNVMEFVPGDFLDNSSPFMYAAANCRVYMLAGWVDNDSFQVPIGEGRSTTATPIYVPVLISSANNVLRCQYRTDAGTNYTAQIGGDIAGAGVTYRLIVVSDDGTQFQGRVDGTDGTPLAFTIAATTLDRFTIGALTRNGTTSDFSKGNLAEIVITDGSDTMATMEDYLTDKWGI